MSNSLLLIALLSHCTVPGLPENILAFEGGDVILPCSFNITAISDFPDVEWSKKGLEPNVVFLYRDGCETYEMNDRAFEYRTSLIPKELKNGNISLRISNVLLSDAGTYKCMTLKNGPQDVTTVELVVGTVSEPKLSVVSAGCGGLTVQCEANTSLLEPEITFLDDQGNELPAEDLKRDKDGLGNYTARRRMNLFSATSFRPSITCRVHHPEFNLVRHTDILIPAHIISSCCLITFITIGWSILSFVITCGLAIWLWKRCGKSGQTLSDIGQVSEESPLRICIEKSHVEQCDWADNVANGANDTLQREVTHLKLQLHKRNETIRHLLIAGVCQYKQPRFVRSDYISTPTLNTNTNPPKPDTLQSSNPTADKRNQRRNSSPGSLPVTARRKKLASIGRSLSESSAQPRRKLSKLQRRHSSEFQSKPQSTNPYTVLGDVTEESEPLMSLEKKTN
ncbi:Butyrophilin subfamily 1 member A1 [Channa argus]|uniref:Butyrophilin subfamily 1 member A1 n=1 Tax=Channa argus TaxID=215402 RepID=A0A6G1Q639_CHAAH|nr:Butyrophilin subfamily 1 member A1 [Channa argus]KAK2899607.1 hypothetical protein Q8A73_012736 [Channa argus]